MDPSVDSLLSPNEGGGGNIPSPAPKTGGGGGDASEAGGSSSFSSDDSIELSESVDPSVDSLLSPNEGGGGETPSSPRTGGGGIFEVGISASVEGTVSSLRSKGGVGDFLKGG